MKEALCRVSAIAPHFGEEPPLVGRRGSGTIFFSNCNLRCVFCQNWQISRDLIDEREMKPAELADQMLRLQALGCHNVNLVSPSHQARAVAESLQIARERGLEIPAVYNTNAYDAVDVLKRFEGLVDIYLPDLKYADDKIAWKLSACRGYVERSRAAIEEMFRQVGHLSEEEADAVARRGLIVRHLVMPGDLSGSFECLRWLADAVGTELWMSLMSQYNPDHISQSGRADVLREFPQLGRRISLREYRDVVDFAGRLGFENFWAQDPVCSPGHGSPDFEEEAPFRWDGEGPVKRIY